MPGEFNEKRFVGFLAAHRTLLSSNSDYIEGQGRRAEHFWRTHCFGGKSKARVIVIELLLSIKILPPAGQCYISDSGRKESHERRRVHRQVFLCRINKIHETRNRICKLRRISS